MTADLSGPALNQALIEVSSAAGVNVIDIGMVPTPALYFATVLLGTGSGIMITGSHNPTDYNGFKDHARRRTLADEAISSSTSESSVTAYIPTQSAGRYPSAGCTPDYIARIAEQRPLDTQNTDTTESCCRLWQWRGRPLDAPSCSNA